MTKTRATTINLRPSLTPRRRPIGRGVAIMLAAVVGVTGCASEIGGAGDTGGEGDAAGDVAESVEIDMASVYDAQAPQSEAAEQFTEMVAECSDGSITVDFFPNGALGTENDNFSAVSSGELQMTLAGAVGPGMFAPEYMFYQAPFMMEDEEHVRAFIESDLHAGLVEAMDENNVHMLSNIYRGTRNSTGNEPFATPEELAGTPFRLPEIPSWVTVWSELGIDATPVALPELYSALQTGVVDASEGPYEQFATFSLDEVQDYVVNTEHVFEVVQFWIGKDLYDSLSDEQRECVDQSADEAAEIGTQLAEEANEGFLQELQEGGMEVIEPDRAAFQEAAREPLQQLFETEWTVTTYDEVMELADQ